MIQILSNTDLFTVEADVYAHGCNVYGLMGHGIALDFKNRYPEMHRNYVEICAAHKEKLAGGVMFWTQSSPAIANLFTQVRPGKDARLNLIESSFKILLKKAKEKNWSTIAIPAIGCGIGGLNFPDVYAIIDSLLKQEDYASIKEKDNAINVKVCFL